jgi:phosphatidylserine/phosphatidylglycerophosphate/cardiolipin synthase-like enzyme
MKRERLYFALLGMLAGVVMGAAAYQLGFNNACPSKACVGLADVTPVSDRGYFDAAHKALSEAKSSIHIVAYQIDYYPKYPDSTINRLVRDLAYARERGVDVKVVFFDASKDAYDFLKDNDVQVRWAGNETITHAKVIVVDGRTVILGSTNLTHFGLDLNNEADAVITDWNTAGYFENYFENLWKKRH